MVVGGEVWSNSHCDSDDVARDVTRQMMPRHNIVPVLVNWLHGYANVQHGIGQVV